LKEFAAKIDKEIVNAFPVVRTNCEIVIVDTEEEVELALQELYACDVVGFDTETKPCFTKGKINKIALLQLSTKRKCFLFRLQNIEKKENIKEFLESNKILKIGLSVRDDFRMLSRWQTMKPHNFVDLQQFVKNYGIEELGLQKIFAIIFKKKISKKEQLSNWESPTLTQAQQLYAATDAWACRQIYLKLLKISAQ
jgi:ribonuclease D